MTVNAEPMASDGKVRIREDVPYAFTVDDFNFNDNDTSHELVSVSVLEPPARGTLALNGAALLDEAAVTRAEIDRGRLVFTPGVNAYGDTYTSFTFEVSDGTAKSDSYTMTIDVTAENDEAAGVPTIWGTARVGQTLRALTDRIVDFDGLTNTIYSYQWIRVDGSAETDIEDATEPTHSLTTDDVGKKFKVRVSFNDDDGNLETLTSAVFSASGVVTTNITIGSSANMLVSNINRYNDYGSGTPLAYYFGNYLFANKFTTGGNAQGYELDSVEIILGSRTYSNGVLIRVVPSDGSNRPNFSSASSVITLKDRDQIGSGFSRFGARLGTILDASTSYFVVVSGLNRLSPVGYLLAASPAGRTDEGAAEGWSLNWEGIFSGNGVKNWSSIYYPIGYEFLFHAVAVRVNGAAIRNSIPTAAHTSVSTVEDTAYTFDASDFNFNDGDIGDTLTSLTVVTYRLAAGDAGKKFKVRVEFTDLDGTAEALTGAAYPASQSVEQNAVPTGADKTVTVEEDGSYIFAAPAFGFADTDGDALASVKITAPPAAGKGTLALDGSAVTADRVIAASELGKLTYTPPADANGPGYASFAFKVSDGTSESASPYTMTVDVTAVNDAATGAPTISGTARVG